MIKTTTLNLVNLQWVIQRSLNISGVPIFNVALHGKLYFYVTHNLGFITNFVHG